MPDSGDGGRRGPAPADSEGGGEPAGTCSLPPRRPVALLAGTTSVLVTAALFGALLAFLEKVPCRSGAWNSYAKQFQDACYTDIYPLYYGEGLSPGRCRTAATTSNTPS